MTPAKTCYVACSRASTDQPPPLSAGTGTGKTLAFYLPALTFIGSELVAKRKDSVKALAIHPRNELLKDQFIETLRQTRKLNSELAEKRVRKVRIKQRCSAWCH